MKTKRIIYLILLCSILPVLAMAQSPVLHLSFDNHLNGSYGEEPSYHNENQAISFEAGVSGNAAYFPSQGVLRYLAAGNISSLRGTLAYWIKPDWKGTNDHKVFTYGGTGGMQFGTDGNGYYASLINRATGAGEIYANFSTNDWTDGVWYHIAHVWDNQAADNRDALRVYVNGVMLARNDASRDASNIHEIDANDFQLGGYGQDFSLQGSLDELFIYDFPLNDTEIIALYEQKDLPVSLVLPFDGVVTGLAGEQPSMYNYTIPVDFREGVIDQAAFFPEGSRLQFLADENINDLEGTIHYWINTAWFEPAEHTLFNYGTPNDYMKIYLSDDNTYTFTISHNHSKLETSLSAANWEPDTWHHIAHTWNSAAISPGDAMKLYFDGELSGINESEGTGELIQGIGGEFQIGGEGTQNPLEASLDQFIIVDHELSKAEIKTLFDAHIPARESYSLLLDFENNLLGNGGEEPSDNNATAFVQGKYGQALRFNPQNTLIYPFEGNIHPKRGMISCWVSPNWTVNTNHTLFQIDDGSEFFIGSDENADFIFRIGDPANQDAFFIAQFDCSQLSQQSWTHLTFTWDYRASASEDAMSIYLNGNLLARNSTGAAAWNLPSIEGESIQICGSGLQNTFSGVIDRFFILDQIPSLENIQKYMNGYYPVIENMQFFSDTDILLLPGSYTLPDKNEPGVIRLHNIENLSLDGTALNTIGDNGNGICLHLENCSYIDLKNFESISGYFYGIKMINCHHILVDNCNVSDNKKDMDGWIHIWGGPDMAHGGGVFLDHCNDITLTNNILTGQNDGIAAYTCSQMTLRANKCSNNTGYGIRLFHSDDNLLEDNNCSEVNRNTDPSDCASVLLYFCSDNRVINNDFSYGGDGIFINDNKTLGNARQNFKGGNNYFANNNCSYSPHNAIESVFSSGNVFENNTCSFSHYGFWLGYSQNTSVINNTINHNRSAGIAIDRGSSNLIDGNIIRENYIGSMIWQDDSPISGYTDFESRDYDLLRNYFIGNSNGLLLANTENAYVHQNLFITNLIAVWLSEKAINDTITNNRFSNTITYNFLNHSSDQIVAINNSYGTNDETIIQCKIKEQGDPPGSVIWQPFAPVTDPDEQTEPPEDLAEQDAEWISSSDDGALSVVSWDSEDKITGNESLKLSTESGALCHLIYTPGNLVQANWDLSNVSEIVFHVKINKTSGQRLQHSSIILADECQSLLIYTNTAAAVFNAATQWTEIRIPIAGDNVWRRQGAEETLEHISLIQFTLDTWGNGFELWIDNLHFEYSTGIKPHYGSGFSLGDVFPNPTRQSISLPISLEFQDDLTIIIRDKLGREIQETNLPTKKAGKHICTVPLSELAAGFYIMEVRGSFGKRTKQFIIE
ncbi:MAG: T9SS type A sorting domain-containing protein [Bacteroidetes bacterium]|nr:T9SS type A sorting domain-containing protein [Bacteroidota bacterium]MBT4410100.1 T9SS type A sorting domain-containing protein [Bacteroidota bacterium]MBT7091927.1 T9SS type A sorting domain-containing protein [Bacteroidota bacterium]